MVPLDMVIIQIMLSVFKNFWRTTWGPFAYHWWYAYHRLGTPVLGHSNFLINWKVSKNSINWKWNFRSTEKRQFWSSEIRFNDPLSRQLVLISVKHNINWTKSGQQLCSINAMFDLIERSPKLSQNKSILIVKERTVERHTCFDYFYYFSRNFANFLFENNICWYNSCGLGKIRGKTYFQYFSIQKNYYSVKRKNKAFTSCE